MSLIRELLFPQQASNDGLGTGLANPNINDPNYWLLQAWGGRETNAGIRVSPDNSTSLSAYLSGIRNISEDVASLPLILYRRTGDDEREKAVDHPLFDILRYSPNPYSGSMSWRETVQACALGHGNGYSQIVRNFDGSVRALYFLHARRVTCKTMDSGEPYYELRDEKTLEVETLGENEVFHVHGLGGDGVCGWSVLRMAAESVGLGLALQQYAATFFRNGARPSGLLKHPKILQDKGYQRIRESWMARHAGADNAHTLAILEEGMDYVQIGVPPEEAQFLETRKFNVEDIARWFRIPPHKIGHLERATFSNIEEQNREYVQDTLRSWVKRWQEEIWRKLIPAKERKEYYAEHLLDDLLSGNSLARAQFYRELGTIGAISPNTIAKKENLPPGGPEGDERYIQGAMVPLSIAVKGPQKPEAQKPIEKPKANALALVFEDAAARVMRKEEMEVERLVKKHGNTAALQDELGKFHAKQKAYLVEAMMPPSGALAQVTGAQFNAAALLSSYAETLFSGVAGVPQKTPQAIAAEVMALLERN